MQQNMLVKSSNQAWPVAWGCNSAEDAVPHAIACIPSSVTELMKSTILHRPETASKL